MMFRKLSGVIHQEKKIKVETRLWLPSRREEMEKIILFYNTNSIVTIGHLDLNEDTTPNNLFITYKPEKYL